MNIMKLDRIEEVTFDLRVNNVLVKLDMNDISRLVASTIPDLVKKFVDSFNSSNAFPDRNLDPVTMQVFVFMALGYKVDAIKLLRSKYNLGLKEGKDVVEGLVVRLHLLLSEEINQIRK